MIEVTWALLVALVLAQLLDIWTTTKILALHGTEKNPLMRWFMDKVGIHVALWSTKIVVCALLVWVCWQRADLGVQVILGALLGFYAWVLVNNWRALRASEQRG